MVAVYSYYIFKMSYFMLYVCLCSCSRQFR